MAVRKVFRDNALSIVMFALFLVFWGGHSVAGWLNHNEEQSEHGQPAIAYAEYLRSGDFLESTFENWESEFLQMAAFVILTAFLFQRGSAESRDPDGKEDAPSTPPPATLAAFLRAYSLGIALAALFLASFALHLWASYRAALAEAALHGGAQHSLIAHLGGMEFWFESFQNWQSEFLSLAAMVTLTIVLRQRGSPESKPVDAPYWETGN